MNAPTKTEMIAEGKAKKIYATTDPTKLIFHFKAVQKTVAAVNAPLPPPTLAPFEIDAFGATEHDAGSSHQTPAAS